MCLISCDCPEANGVVRVSWSWQKVFGWPTVEWREVILTASILGSVFVETCSSHTVISNIVLGSLAEAKSFLWHTSHLLTTSVDWTFNLLLQFIAGRMKWAWGREGTSNSHWGGENKQTHTHRGSRRNIRGQNEAASDTLVQSPEKFGVPENDRYFWIGSKAKDFHFLKWRFICEHLLSSHCILGTTLGTRSTVVMGRGPAPFLGEFIF